MNKLFDMLTKAGYEVSSIGNDVLPCTLRLGDEPIGFLLGDLSLRLLPEREKERGKVQPILAFSTDNQDIEQERGEYVLSRYQNVLFTATFDYDRCRPIYNVYSRDKDDNWALLNSSEDRAAAARDFATRSGLVSGEIPEPVRNFERINRFMDAVRTKGFQFRESREEANRAFAITDSDGNEVGYIGKDNRVTITSENNRVKNTLTDAYLSSSASVVMLPTFFERLKENLKGISMALKIIFSPKGKHYAIHNESQQEVATVEEKSHAVTYNDRATDEEKAKIDALVEELRREEVQKEREPERIVPEKEVVAQTVPAISVEDIKNLTAAILSDRASTEMFLEAVLSNPDFTALMNQKLAETRQTSVPSKEIHKSDEKDHLPTDKEKVSVSTEKLKQDFDKDYSCLQMLFGFNQDKYDALRSEMTSHFGTADPKEFQAMLDAGAFDGSSKLQARLDTSRRIAETKNAVRQAEKSQEKERV